MGVISSVVLLCFATFVASTPAALRRSGYALKSHHDVPDRWERIARATKTDIIGLRIALKHGAFDELEQRLSAVSDPDSTTYGQWLDTPEINRLIAPRPDSLEAVHAWLSDHAIHNVGTSAAGDWLYVPLQIRDAEYLLDTQYHVYKHKDTGRELVRTSSYGLPKALHDHVELIAPTNYFSSIATMESDIKIAKAADSPSCTSDGSPMPWHGHDPSSWSGPPSSWQSPPSSWQSPPWQHGSPPYQVNPPQTNLSAYCNASAVTNKCLRALYNTLNYVPQAANQNLVSMTAYLNESANISDFRIFMSAARPDAPSTYLYDVVSINGGINYQDREPPELLGSRDLEANLDSQTLGGLIYPTQFDVYSTGGSPPFQPDVNTPVNTNEPYLDWLQYMLGLDQDDLPNTVATAYGDPEQTVPYDYARRVCNEFAALTARGVTLLFSSGDNGVGINGSCFSNTDDFTTQFLPAFPASCPYVTAVGATRNFQPEIVAYDDQNGYVSGSGVSNYFVRPSWQNAAYSDYLQSIGSLHAGLYNTSGRAYPDIAAQGFHYMVVYDGQDILLDGTSCSTPTATAILSLVNDALIAAGRPTLGFLNPWLYKYGYRGFNDIVNGSSTGCSTSGFPALPGWDIASGWGTPDFLRISQLAIRGGTVASPVA